MSAGINLLLLSNLNFVQLTSLKNLDMHVTFQVLLLFNASLAAFIRALRISFFLRFFLIPQFSEDESAYFQVKVYDKTENTTLF